MFYILLQIFSEKLNINNLVTFCKDHSFHMDLTGFDISHLNSTTNWKLLCPFKLEQSTGWMDYDGKGS